jgi:hypothetical protein
MVFDGALSNCRNNLFFGHAVLGPKRASGERLKDDQAK